MADYMKTYEQWVNSSFFDEDTKKELQSIAVRQQTFPDGLVHALRIDRFHFFVGNFMPEFVPDRNADLLVHVFTPFLFFVTWVFYCFSLI